MTCDTHVCVPCGLHEPRRNVYFDGKLLLARDFEDEQVYHMAKQQGLTMRSSRNCIATPSTWQVQLATLPATRCNSA